MLDIDFHKLVWEAQSMQSIVPTGKHIANYKKKLDINWTLRT